MPILVMKVTSAAFCVVRISAYVIYHFHVVEELFFSLLFMADLP